MARAGRRGRGRGRPAMDDSDSLRVRNFHWLVMSEYHGASTAVIAAYARVSERTVRRGLAWARAARRV